MNFVQLCNEIFPVKYIQNIHQEATQDILNELVKFLNNTCHNGKNEVLLAHPGHGKTTALSLLANYILKKKQDIGLLFVVKEIHHMDILIKSLAPQNYKVLYVDNENIQDVRGQIKHTQIVVITHARFEELAVELNQKERVNNFTKWNGQKRKIIIDEMPKMINSFIFQLTDECKWINDWLEVNEKEHTIDDRIKLRDLIITLLKKKITNEKGIKTGKSLLSEIENEEKKTKLEDFIEITEKKLYEITSFESRNIFRWFKKLCEEDNVGYMDKESFTNEKKIICSKKIDYQKLNCPILIMDGTAFATPTHYKDYRINSLQNHTLHERLIIHHHNINTSNWNRTNGSNKTYKSICNQIMRLRKDKHNPFILTYKDDYNYYKKVGLIDRDNPLYDNINIFTTAGKNFLADYNDLYLGALPILPPAHYKSVAIAIFDNDKEPLDLSMNKDNAVKQWFTDSRIEKVYRELVLKEIIQIIYRSNIRNLLVPKHSKVNIYIATKHKQFLFDLQMIFNQNGMEKVTFNFDTKTVEQLLKIKEDSNKHAKTIYEAIQNKQIQLPQPIGKIEDTNRIKIFVNRNWELHQDLIQSAFAKLGLKFRLNSKGWKEIDWLN